MQATQTKLLLLNRPQRASSLSFNNGCEQKCNWNGSLGGAACKTCAPRSTTVPYLFLKAPSTLCGAFDDIEIPRGMKKIDWEAEIALAIAKRGKRIKAERALNHVAGFMTTNDVSCRDLQIRQDRPALRSDWLGGKSHDNFAPMGCPCSNLHKAEKHWRFSRASRTVTAW
jgi:2-keto-4-pentenoate hydratase/2-oxohepta-3-ene-1,7-dioic acid hydratase in catechol pathway